MQMGARCYAPADGPRRSRSSRSHRHFPRRPPPFSVLLFTRCNHRVSMASRKPCVFRHSRLNIVTRTFFSQEMKIRAATLQQNLRFICPAAPGSACVRDKSPARFNRSPTPVRIRTAYRPSRTDHSVRHSRLKPHSSRLARDKTDKTPRILSPREPASLAPTLSPFDSSTL